MCVYIFIYLVDKYVNSYVEYKYKYVEYLGVFVIFLLRHQVIRVADWWVITRHG